MDRAEEEMLLFRSFVIPQKRRRYVELLGRRSGRDKIRRSLDHFKDLDPRFCSRIQRDQQRPNEILGMLNALGAPPVCWIISSNIDVDAREMDLPDALAKIAGVGCGTFLSCLPGVLAYFEGEETNARYICRRAEARLR